MTGGTLKLRVLGEIEVSRGSEVLSLPPSKKTRALLAYLVMTGRTHRRERLCELLWDIPDDPRGALRWSLSRIRGIVDEGDTKRIVANRESVTFERQGAEVDLIEIRRKFSGGIEAADLPTLRAAADAFRGEFLEGLELTDYHDFQAWCVAEREESRVLQAGILRNLVEQLTPQDVGVLEYARAWVKADPFECKPRCTLVNLLFESGRRSEAEKQYEYGVRVLEDAGSSTVGGLHGLWKTLNAGGSRQLVRQSDGLPPLVGETLAPEVEGAVADRPAVAVLPFSFMSDAGADEFFADGLTEDLITALSASRLFPVIGRNSTFTYKGRNVRVEEVASELGARYILEGSVRRSGDRVRISAQLIDAANGHHLWAEKYDRHLDDVFAVQDDITARIAAIVEPELSKIEHRRQSLNPPKIFAAWELCVRGSAALHAGTQEGNEEAKELFTHAASLDPAYSHAQAGLAYSYYRDLFLAVADDDEDTLAKCREHAERAIDLDPLDAFAQGTLGLAYLRSGQFALAVEQGRKAVEINPGRVASFALIGTALNGAGRPLDGIPYLERSLELNLIDPRNFIYMAFLAEAYFQAAQYEDAALWARKSLQQRPGHLEAQLVLAASLGQSGHTEEAGAVLAICEQLDADYASTWRRRWAFRSQEDIAHIAGGLRRAGLLVGTRDIGHRPQDRLVGRSAEITQLIDTFDATVASGRRHVVLMTGEPGVGKSRMVREIIEMSGRYDASVIEAHTYDGESGRPYGPWIDALTGIRETVTDASLVDDLAPLLPSSTNSAAINHSRDRLLSGMGRLISSMTEDSRLLLIVIDDVQWLDIASATLLRHAMRDSAEERVMFVLAAREGELQDNTHLNRYLARMRQDKSLDEIKLTPLNQDEMMELIERAMPQVDSARVFQESAGNPLLALEIARSLPGRQDDGPQSLSSLLMQRVNRLPSDGGKVIHWAAVIGPISHGRLLAKMTGLNEEELTMGLEVLERHGFLRAERSGDPVLENRYKFAHDLVRRSIYLALPEPRRRMLHLRVTDAMRELGGNPEEVAADIAYHASRGGEYAIAAHACVTAGRRSLRLYANTDAYTMARRGIHYAEHLAEKEQFERTLELIEISLEARQPEAPEAVVRMIERHVKGAIEMGSASHARLGFEMISKIHWERGNLIDAPDQSVRVERITGDDLQRAHGMVEAAHCLVMLERDLDHALALLKEASTVLDPQMSSSVMLPLVSGMMRLREGDDQAAEQCFAEARSVAELSGDRFRKFLALEQQFVLSFQRQDYAKALQSAQELVEAGKYMRKGSEAAFAQALLALAEYACGADAALETLDNALVDLRRADAKQRLTHILNRAASLEHQRGRNRRAISRAEEALGYARAMSRASEVVFAEAILVRAAVADNSMSSAMEWLGNIEDSDLAILAADARSIAELALAESRESHVDITTGGVQ